MLERAAHGCETFSEYCCAVFVLVKTLDEDSAGLAIDGVVFITPEAGGIVCEAHGVGIVDIDLPIAGFR